MKQLILIPVFALSLTACLTEAAGTLNEKACTSAATTSTITIQVSSSRALPPFFLATINNGMVPLNECTLGSNTADYTITRADERNALITLWIQKDSAIYRHYFDEAGSPRPNPRLSVWLYGQASCNRFQEIIREYNRTLQWTLVDANSTACVPSVYAATIP